MPRGALESFSGRILKLYIYQWKYINLQITFLLSSSQLVYIEFNYKFLPMTFLGS